MSRNNIDAPVQWKQHFRNQIALQKIVFTGVDVQDNGEDLVSGNIKEMKEWQQYMFTSLADFKQEKEFKDRDD